MVYSDESYVHNNHTLTMGWFGPGSSRGVKHDKRTVRFIIIHAMTEHGLLVADNEAIDITDDLTVCAQFRRVHLPLYRGQIQRR